ncbi:MAG: hypothetical protein JXA87_07810 [Thermoleophilia bacterium]|nr:hypothetical protein [Thermoleophilia bacterium]
MTEPVTWEARFVLGKQWHHVEPPEEFGMTTWADFIDPPENAEDYPFQFQLRPQDYGGQLRTVGHGLRDYEGPTISFMCKFRPIFGVDSTEAPARPALTIELGLTTGQIHVPEDGRSMTNDSLGLYYLPVEPPSEALFLSWPEHGVPNWWSLGIVPACSPSYLAGPFTGLETRTIPLTNTSHLNRNGMTYFQLRGLSEDEELFWNVYAPPDPSYWGWPKFDALAVEQYWKYATMARVTGWSSGGGLTLLSPRSASARCGVRLRGA